MEIKERKLQEFELHPTFFIAMDVIKTALMESEGFSLKNLFTKPVDKEETIQIFETGIFYSAPVIGDVMTQYFIIQIQKLKLTFYLRLENLEQQEWQPVEITLRKNNIFSSYEISQRSFGYSLKKCKFTEWKLQGIKDELEKIFPKKESGNGK